MRRVFLVAMTFALAMVVGVGLASIWADQAQAKPMVCKLMVEPFYYCEPHASCHNPGEERCWLCLGIDLEGVPCLCSRVGCMIPPE